jgi:nitrogen fixation NifU-like protein
MNPSGSNHEQEYMKDLDPLAREMYKEHILELYKRPHNKGKLKTASHICHGSNMPLCADEITIQLNINKEKNTVEEVAFEGSACALCTASTSLITDHVKGKTVEEVKKISSDDMRELIEIPVSQGRIKCLLLPLDTLQKALTAKKE